MSSNVGIRSLVLPRESVNFYFATSRHLTARFVLAMGHVSSALQVITHSNMDNILVKLLAIHVTMRLLGVKYAIKMDNVGNAPNLILTIKACVIPHQEI